MWIITGEGRKQAYLEGNYTKGNETNKDNKVNYSKTVSSWSAGRNVNTKHEYSQKQPHKAMMFDMQWNYKMEACSVFHLAVLGGCIWIPCRLSQINLWFCLMYTCTSHDPFVICMEIKLPSMMIIGTAQHLPCVYYLNIPYHTGLLFEGKLQ